MRPPCVDEVVNVRETAGSRAWESPASPESEFPATSRSFAPELIEGLLVRVQPEELDQCEMGPHKRTFTCLTHGAAARRYCVVRTPSCATERRAARMAPSRLIWRVVLDRSNSRA